MAGVVYLLPGLRSLRMRRVLSQAGLAKAAGVGVSTVAGAEQGYAVRRESVEKMARALGIDAQVLIEAKPARRRANSKQRVRRKKAEGDS